MVDKELYRLLDVGVTGLSNLARKLAAEDVARMLGMVDIERLTDEQLTAIVARALSKTLSELGPIASEAACDFYRQQRALSGLDDDFTALPRPNTPSSYVLADAKDAARAHLGGRLNIESLASAVGGRASRLIHDRADATIIYNSRRDGARPKWALVPHAGACGWCVLIGSNGFAYRSMKTAGSTRHTSCHCTLVCDFDTNNPLLEGYDVDALKKQYALGVDAAGDLRSEWEGLSSEEKSRYGKRGYSAFERDRIVKAMNERRDRVREYERGVARYDRLIKKAKSSNGAKASERVWMNQVGELLESVCPKGGSITAQYGAQFDGSELMTAVALARDGHDVMLVRARNSPGLHTADFLIDGVLTEAKRLESWNIGRLGKKIWEASAQSRDVLIDLRLETIPPTEARAKAIEELSRKTYRYLSKYEKDNGFSRGKPEVRVDSITLVFHDHVEVIAG